MLFVRANQKYAHITSTCSKQSGKGGEDMSQMKVDGVDVPFPILTYTVAPVALRGPEN